MKLIDTTIADVKIIEPKVFGDERGFFMETWNRAVFSELGIDENFVQDNHSRSRQGILRGLHYQIKNPQGKLVRVLYGKVLDVAVDMRRSSSTFGKSVAIELNGDDHRMLWIPPGFAHGFYVLSEKVDFLYKCTALYTPEHEKSLLWSDPALDIDWKLLEGKAPLLSAKDLAGVPLAQAETFA